VDKELYELLICVFSLQPVLLPLPRRVHPGGLVETFIFIPPPAPPSPWPLVQDPLFVSRRLHGLIRPVLKIEKRLRVSFCFQYSPNAPSLFLVPPCEGTKDSGRSTFTRFGHTLPFLYFNPPFGRSTFPLPSHSTP